MNLHARPLRGSFGEPLLRGSFSERLLDDDRDYVTDLTSYVRSGCVRRVLVVAGHTLTLNREQLVIDQAE